MQMSFIKSYLHFAPPFVILAQLIAFIYKELYVVQSSLSKSCVSSTQAEPSYLQGPFATIIQA